MPATPTQFVDPFEQAFNAFGLRFQWTQAGARAEGPGSTVFLENEEYPCNFSGVSWQNKGEDGQPWFGSIQGAYAFHFDGILDCLMPLDGSRLRLFVDPGSEPSLVSFVLFRGLAPRLLHLRGIPSLHASAVLRGQEIVGFVGRSGVGKSTLAAALVARGSVLVSDDVLPLRRAPSGRILAGPGLREVRLERAAAKLADVLSELAPPGRRQTKGRWFPPPGQFLESSRPLAGLYLLDPRTPSPNTASSASTPVRLRAAPALRALVQNSFWLHPKETRALANDLDYFADIVRSVPIYTLPLELTLHGLDAVREATLEQPCA